MIKTNFVSPRWTLFQKITFRFFFCYFLLYIFPFPMGNIPLIGQYIYSPTFHFWKWLSALVAENIFHISDFKIVFNGSGDKTSDYIKLFCILCLSFIFTAIWSILDKKRKGYGTLRSYFTIYLRYYLAFFLFSYGISKIFTNQFSDLSLFDLIKTYGDSSPMGLMWNFMEYSDTYTIFSGISEVIGGLLLLFRRTSKLGALVSFGVMLNVFMMNLSYDIPVKLFSLHLTLIALFILVPEFKNLVRYFILNKPTIPTKANHYFNQRKYNILGFALKFVFIAFIIISITSGQIKTQKEWGKKAFLPKLYGIYNVQTFSINNKDIQPLATDSLRWSKLVIDKFTTGIIKMNNSKEYFKNKTDTLANNLKLTSSKDSLKAYRFTYKKRDSILWLNGHLDNDTIHIQLIREDHTKYQLLKRKFHWVNEYPFNR